jgi:hypothetical protein
VAVVYINNTNELLLKGLRSEVEGQYLNAATVTVTVKDAAGADVAGTTWPKAMGYVAGTDGNYRVILGDVIVFLVGVQYTAHVSVDAGVDRIARWKYNFIAKERTAS